MKKPITFALNPIRVVHPTDDGFTFVDINGEPKESAAVGCFIDSGERAHVHHCTNRVPVEDEAAIRSILVAIACVRHEAATFHSEKRITFTLNVESKVGLDELERRLFAIMDRGADDHGPTAA